MLNRHYVPYHKLEIRFQITIFFDSIEYAAVLCAIHGCKVFVSVFAYTAAGIYGRCKAAVLAMELAAENVVFLLTC